MIVAIYDGQCVICNTTRHIVQALDWRKRVRFFDLHQHAQLRQTYPDIDPQAAMGAIHVVDDYGRVYAGFSGTRRMLRALPLAWPMYVLLRLPVVSGWLGPKVYNFIARNRYAINRLLGVDLAQGTDACEQGICKMPE